MEIRLPPLRERREDVPALATHFLRGRAARYGRRVDGFAPEAMQALLDYAWPGNVRELEHTVERALLLMQGTTVHPADLALPAAHGGAAASLDDMPLEEVERVLIRKALQRHDGNVSQAAEALGLSRSALYRRLQRYGL